MNVMLVKWNARLATWFGVGQMHIDVWRPISSARTGSRPDNLVEAGFFLSTKTLRRVVVSQFVFSKSVCVGFRTVNEFGCSWCLVTLWWLVQCRAGS